MLRMNKNLIIIGALVLGGCEGSLQQSGHVKVSDSVASTQKSLSLTFRVMRFPGPLRARWASKAHVSPRLTRRRWLLKMLAVRLLSTA